MEWLQGGGPVEEDDCISLLKKLSRRGTVKEHDSGGREREGEREKEREGETCSLEDTPLMWHLGSQC